MSRGLFRYLLGLVVATWCLLIAGGLVTSTGSGLAVPDWPLSYGTLFPPMVGGIIYEHSHRVIASFIGLLTVILAAWLARATKRGELPSHVGRLGWVALGLVLAQGGLGGLTVLRRLPPWVSIAHACLAQLFFCTVVSLAVLISPGYRAWRVEEDPRRVREDDVSRWLPISAGFAFAALFVQLVLGANLRHTGQGVEWHWVGAAVASVALGWVQVLIRRLTGDRRSGLSTASLVALALLSFQIALGGSLYVWFFPRTTLTLGTEVLLTTLHLAVGAALLASSVVLALLAWRSGVGAGMGRRQRECPGDTRLTRWPIRPLAARVSAYIELMKPRLNVMTLLAAGAGWCLASPATFGTPFSEALGPFGTQGSGSLGRPIIKNITSPFGTAEFWWMLAGTAGIAWGAAALNMVLERGSDALMSRTAGRPLPSGRVTRAEAVIFGGGLIVVGWAMLFAKTTPLAAWLGGLSAGLYLAAYTPLKRHTPWCVAVGAVSGALPPLIGWSAATGTLAMGAWSLFAILFAWQIPHFLSLAWLYREEYARAGLRMAPRDDPEGRLVSRLVMAGTALLAWVSLWPGFFQFTSGGGLGVAIFLSLGAALASLNFQWERSEAAARSVFLTSLAYLPLLFGALILFRV